MRTLLAVSCGLCSWLLLASTSQAQDNECQAVIAKAMKAVGGEDKLAAFKASYMKAKGTISVMGMDAEFSGEVFTQQPDKQKLVVDVSFMNNNVTITRVIDGAKGWLNIKENTEELDAQELMEAKEAMHLERVISLKALKDKAYKLAPLGEVKVGDQQTVGIQVSRKGYRDISLYFDKNTYLLVKSETRALDPGKQEVTQEKLFSDYKELVPGLKLPSKMVINNDGKKYMNLTVTEVQLVEKHDASIFAKP